MERMLAEAAVAWFVISIPVALVMSKWLSRAAVEVAVVQTPTRRAA